MKIIFFRLVENSTSQKSDFALLYCISKKFVDDWAGHKAVTRTRARAGKVYNKRHLVNIRESSRKAKDRDPQVTPRNE